MLLTMHFEYFQSKKPRIHRMQGLYIIKEKVFTIRFLRLLILGYKMLFEFDDDVLQKA